MAVAHYRKIIKISAWDSPNVRLALEQQRRGLPITNEEVFPNVVTWSQLQHRLRTWDDQRKCVGLEAEFYEGAEVLLWPEAVLQAAEARWRALPARTPMGSKVTMGVDPAEGGDRSMWVIGSSLGAIRCIGFKTPNTTVIPAMTTALIREFSIKPEDV